MQNSNNIFFKKYQQFIKSSFLEKCDDIFFLKQDASKRKYARVSKDNHNYVLMDCAEDFDALISFIKITDLLKKNNFSVPKILYQDLKNFPYLLIEDFGDNSFNQYLEHQQKKQDKIYFLAIDNLIKLSSIPAPTSLPKHSKKLLLGGIALFNKYNIDKKYKISKEILAGLDFKEQKYICLRDFHADNLFFLKNRTSYKQIGLIDYQDASIGFLSYDLLSLLQDARRYIASKDEQKYLAYFYQHMQKTSNNFNQEEFKKEYHILSKQRNSRIIGLFNKFAKIDGKTEYLSYLKNVFRYFER